MWRLGADSFGCHVRVKMRMENVASEQSISISEDLVRLLWEVTGELHERD